MGRAVAFKLAEAGIDVDLADIDKKKAEETAAAVTELGVRSKAYHIDISRSDQVAKAFNSARDEAD